MNTNFETKFGGGKSATVEWYTPPYIIEALGNNFDLDPAAPKKIGIQQESALLKKTMD